MYNVHVYLSVIWIPCSHQSRVNHFPCNHYRRLPKSVEFTINKISMPIHISPFIPRFGPFNFIFPSRISHPEHTSLVLFHFWWCWFNRPKSYRHSPNPNLSDMCSNVHSIFPSKISHSHNSPLIPVLIARILQMISSKLFPGFQLFGTLEGSQNKTRSWLSWFCLPSGYSQVSTLVRKLLDSPYDMGGPPEVSPSSCEKKCMSFPMIFHDFSITSI